jgi:hypothetical protein
MKQEHQWPLFIVGPILLTGLHTIAWGFSFFYNIGLYIDHNSFAQFFHAEYEAITKVVTKEPNGHFER